MRIKEIKLSGGQSMKKCNSIDVKGQAQTPKTDQRRVPAGCEV